MSRYGIFETYLEEIKNAKRNKRKKKRKARELKEKKTQHISFLQKEKKWLRKKMTSTKKHSLIRNLY